MALTHKNAILLGRIINCLQDCTLIEGDLVFDEVRRYFFCIHYAGFSKAEAQTDLGLSRPALKIIQLLKESLLPQAGALIERARGEIWSGSNVIDDSEDLYGGENFFDVLEEKSDNIARASKSSDNIIDFSHEKVKRDTCNY